VFRCASHRHVTFTFDGDEDEPFQNHPGRGCWRHRDERRDGAHLPLDWVRCQRRRLPTEPVNSEPQTHRYLDGDRATALGRYSTRSDHPGAYPLRYCSRLPLPLDQSGVADRNCEPRIILRVARLLADIPLLGVLHALQPVRRTSLAHRHRTVFLGRHRSGRRLRDFNDHGTKNIEPTGRGDAVNRAPHPSRYMAHLK